MVSVDRHAIMSTQRLFLGGGNLGDICVAKTWPVFFAGVDFNPCQSIIKLHSVCAHARQEQVALQEKWGAGAKNIIYVNSFINIKVVRFCYTKPKEFPLLCGQRRVVLEQQLEAKGVRYVSFAEEDIGCLSGAMQESKGE